MAKLDPKERLWSLGTIAEYLEMSVSHVSQQVVAQPDFPQPFRLCGTGHPRWKAAEVMEWVERR